MRAQIVNAPERPAFEHAAKLFLAGTTPTVEPGQPVDDWRHVVIEATKALAITIYNPVRPDWDASWVEDASFAPFRQQVEWELDRQNEADVIAVFFDPAKDGMVSLLELGLCARMGKAIVACPPEYKKRGNVELVCRRFGVRMTETAEDLARDVAEKMAEVYRQKTLTSSE